MKLFILIFIFLLPVSKFCYAENNINNIIIDSILTDCIKIKKNELVAYHNFLFLDTSWDVKNNIGNCGCKSALIQYDVNLISDQQHIVHGVVSSLKKKNHEFIINSDNSIFKNERFKLIINCAN
ncbi:MAG: DUF2195 family protein [Thiohalomonadales bacterium]